MKQVRRLAVIGLGQLGRACAEALLAQEHFELAGVVRRAESLDEPLPGRLAACPAVSHISELQRAEAALVCVPAAQVDEVARELLQHRIPLVECASFHGEDFAQHKSRLDRLARHNETAAILGAGWDPGALSLFRALFALLTPKGHTESRPRCGVSLHHSTVAGAVPGVKEALSTELLSKEGRAQRYIYVELEEGRQFEEVAEAIRNDPLFVGEETLVFPVENVAALEEEGQGVLMERRGSAGAVGHQLLLLEGRFSEHALAAQVMLAAARALPTRHHRAYSLFDLPQRALWGELHELVERQWL